MNKAVNEFLNKLNPDMVEKTLLQLSIPDIVNFCHINSKIKANVCKENFWRRIAQNKLKIKYRGDYSTWEKLVSSYYTYSKNDIYNIAQSYNHDVFTKNEATKMIHQLITTNQLTYRDRNGQKAIIEAIKDAITNFYQNLADQYYYDPYYDPETGTNPKEEVLDDEYWVYFNLNKKYIEVFNYKNKNNQNLILLASAEVKPDLIETAKIELEKELE